MPPRSSSFKQFAGGLGDLAQRGGHHLELSLESSPSWRALVKSGSLAARDAAARRPLAAPLEEPESFPSHSAADPWPVFGVLTALDHLRGVESHPRGRHPLGLTEQRHELPADTPERAPGIGRRTTSRMSRTACSISACWAASEEAPPRLGVSLRPQENHTEGV